jgi:hypothetical protein
MIECTPFANVCYVKGGKSAFEIFVSSVTFLKIVMNLKSRGKHTL